MGTTNRKILAELTAQTGELYRIRQGVEALAANHGQPPAVPYTPGPGFWMPATVADDAPTGEVPPGPLFPGDPVGEVPPDVATAELGERTAHREAEGWAELAQRYGETLRAIAAVVQDSDATSAVQRIREILADDGWL